MKILLTGATGLVGKRLTQRLFEQGHDLVVLARDAESARSGLSVPAEVFAWPPGREPLPARVFQGVQAIFHLAGEPVAGKRWSDEQKRRIIDSRVETARQLLSGAQASGGVDCYISASATGFYGDRGDEVLTEASKAGEGFLADVCRKWEEIAREFPQAYRRAAFLRTGIALAKEGGALAKLLPLFQAGLGGPLGNGRQWMSWIHLDDLIALYLKCLEDTSFSGPINAISPEPVTNEEFTRALAEVLRRPAVFRAPRLAMQVALGEMSQVLLGSQRVLPARAQAAAFSFRFPRLVDALSAIVGAGGAEAGDEIFAAEQWIPKPVAEIFSFFSEAGNLETLTPPWLGFKILRKPSAGIEAGSLIDYRLTIHGLPIKWRTRIDTWNVNESFQDTQLKGPYHKWEHTHTFVPSRGGTLMKDRVRFSLPGGMLANKTVGVAVRRDIEKIFAFRKLKIRELFG